MKKLSLFLENRDFAAVSELIRREGIKLSSSTDDERVYLVPASLLDTNERFSELRYFRFPGSIEIYFAFKTDVYCKP